MIIQGYRFGDRMRYGASKTAHEIAAATTAEPYENDSPNHLRTWCGKSAWQAFSPAKPGDRPCKACQKARKARGAHHEAA